MWNTMPGVPCPVNEQKLEYNAGPDERKEIQFTCIAGNLALAPAVRKFYAPDRFSLHLYEYGDAMTGRIRCIKPALTISLSRGNLYPGEGKA